MSDPVQLALIAAGVSVVSLITNTILQVKTFRRMGTLEKQTNSIKDALVESTGTEAYARGVKDQTDREQGGPGPVGFRGGMI